MHVFFLIEIYDQRCHNRIMNANFGNIFYKMIAIVIQCFTHASIIKISIFVCNSSFLFLKGMKSNPVTSTAYSNIKIIIHRFLYRGKNYPIFFSSPLFSSASLAVIYFVYLPNHSYGSFNLGALTCTFIASFLDIEQR